MIIKRSLFIIFLTFLYSIHKSLQKVIYQQSDRIFIKFEQKIYSDIPAGSSKDYEIVFPNDQFQNDPKILYSTQVYNIDNESKQGYTITTLSSSKTNLKYRVTSLGSLIGQIHFQVLAVDDPSITVINEKVILSSNTITFQGTSKILIFGAFITGLKGNNGSLLKLSQVYNKLDDMTYTISFSQTNIQELYLNYLVVYENNSSPYSFLYSFKQIIDPRKSSPTTSSVVKWNEDTSLIDGSSVLFGFKDFKLDSYKFFGGKIQASGKLVSGSKVNIEYFTWDGMMLSNANGLQVQFMVKNCEQSEYMYVDQVNKNIQCTKACSQIDYHYNNNPANIQTLYKLKIPMCQICNDNCFGCIDGSPDKCIDCYNGKYLNPLNQKCEDSQPAGTYCEDKTVNDNTFKNCQQCYLSCAKCTGPNTNQCTMCTSTYKFFYNGQCLNFQKPSTYCDENNVCKDCSTSCLECVSSPDNCLSCNNKYFYNNKCLDIPTEGIFCNSKTDCKPCSNTCKGCIESADKCTSCQKDQYFYNNTCTSQKIPGVYCKIMSDYQQCFTCSNAACLECTEQQPNVCISCPDDKYLYKGQCFSSPPDKTYCINKVCQDCHNSCSKCTGESKNDCQECNINRSMDDNKICKCNSDYFENANLECIKCDSSCATCERTSTQCLSCASSYYLYQGQCIQSQPPHSYCDEAAKKCYPCNKMCQECTGANENECKSCYNGFQFNQLLGICECQQKQYPIYEIDKMICRDCHSSCLSCSGPSEKDCLSCSNYFYKNQCFDQQPDGTFCINKICESCSKECKTCENTASNCTSCSDQYYPETNSCLKCHQHCKQCYGPSSNQCIQCIGNLIKLQDDTCGCQSSQFIFSSSSTDYLCEQCSNKCQECDGPNDNSCTGCKSDQFLYNKSCLVTKPPTTYCDPKNICKDCYTNCQSCAGLLSDNCSSCKPGFNLYKGQCIDKVLEKTYCVSNVCYDCDKSCENCKDSSTNCTSCKQNEFLYQGLCKQKQPDQTYCTKTGIYLNCQTCDLSCYSCNGLTNQDCSGCSLDKYLYKSQCVSTLPDKIFCAGNKCFDCHISCQTCTGPSSSECSACVGNKIISQSSSLCICKPSFYLSDSQDSNSECLPCSSGCTSCENKNICKECDSSQFLYKDQCQQSKPDKTFCIENKCQDCHVDCLECNGSLQSNCQKCFGDKIIDPNTKQCVCPQSFYSDDSYITSGKCLKCEIGCLECSSQLKCLKCSKSETNSQQLYMYQDKCYNTEPNNSYCDKITFICTKCEQNCQKCDQSLSKCTECPPQMYLYNGICSVDKPKQDGVFCDEITYLCSSCSENCFNCNIKADKCTQCKIGSYLFQDKCYLEQPPQTNCILNEKLSYDCDSCTASYCKTCNKQKNHCDSCIAGSILDSKTQSCNCSEGYFVAEETSNKQPSCQKCSQINCSKCDKNSCKKCLPGFFQNNKQECEYCSNKTFADDQNNCNQSCPKSCLLCSSSTKCEKVEENPKCHQNCLTCSGSLETDCLTCFSSTRELDQITKLCKCKQHYKEIGQIDCQLIDLVPEPIINASKAVGTVSLSLTSVSVVTNFIPGLSYTFSLMQVLADFHQKDDDNFNYATNILKSYSNFNFHSLFSQQISQKQTQPDKKQEQRILHNNFRGDNKLIETDSLEKTPIKESDKIFKQTNIAYFADYNIIQLCIISFLFFIAQILHFYQTRTHLNYKYFNFIRWNLVLVVIQLSSNFMLLTLLKCNLSEQRIIDYFTIGVFVLMYSSFLYYIFNCIKKNENNDPSVSVLSSGINQRNIYSKYFFLIFELRKLLFCFIISVSRQNLTFTFGVILLIQVISIYADIKFQTMKIKSSKIILLASEVLFTLIVGLLGLILNINDDSINKILATCLSCLIIAFSLFSVASILYLIAVKIKQSCFSKSDSLQYSDRTTIDTKVKALQNSFNISQISQSVKWNVNPLKRSSNNNNEKLACEMSRNSYK